MSVNSRLKATKIICQSKAFYGQRISGSSCAKKETVNMNILVPSRNGDRKIMQFIRITSRPPRRIRKWNQFSEFRWTHTKLKSIEKIWAGYPFNTTFLYQNLMGNPKKKQKKSKFPNILTATNVFLWSCINLISEHKKLSRICGLDFPYLENSVRVLIKDFT